MEGKYVGAQNSHACSVDHVGSSGKRNQIQDKVNEKILSLASRELKTTSRRLSNSGSRRESDVAISRKMIESLLKTKISPIEKPSNLANSVALRTGHVKPKTPSQIHKSLPVADTAKRTVEIKTDSVDSKCSENALSRSFIEDSILSNGGSFLENIHNGSQSDRNCYSGKESCSKKSDLKFPDALPQPNAATSTSNFRKDLRRVKFKSPESSFKDQTGCWAGMCSSPVAQKSGIEFATNGGFSETHSDYEGEDDKINDKTHLLNGVIAFVDVRSSHDNRSAGVAKVLEKLGATVVRKLIPEITHVIFSNGLKSTMNYVDKYNIHFVSVLWVDSCMKNNCRADEHLYPASRMDAVSPMPLMRGKSKRPKSMQPKPFQNDTESATYISMEDIEMKELSKKMKDHDTHFYSPISTGSPFFNQVMRKLNEKRVSLGESPECSKNKVDANEESKEHQVNDRDADIACDSSASKIPHMLDLEPTSEERKLSSQKEFKKDQAASKPCARDEEDWPVPLNYEPFEAAEERDKKAEERADRCRAITNTRQEIMENAPSNRNDSELTTAGADQIGPSNLRDHGITNSMVQITEQSILRDHAIKKASVENTEPSNLRDHGITNYRVQIREQSILRDHAITKASIENTEPSNFRDNGITNYRVQTMEQSILRDHAITKASVENTEPSNFRDNGITKTIVENTEQSSCTDSRCFVKPARKKKKLLSKSQMLAPLTDSASKKEEGQKTLESIWSTAKTLPQERVRIPTATKRKMQEEMSPRKKQRGNPETYNQSVKCADSGTESDELNDNFQAEMDIDDKNPQDDNMKHVNGLDNQEGENFMEEGKNHNETRPHKSLVMTSLHFSQQDFVRKVVKTLGSFTISRTVNSATTHIISGSGRRTLNILNGIAHGCWILSPNWINCSYDEGHWLSEEGFELVDVFQTAKENRCSKLATGKSLSSCLFNNEEPFYIAEGTVPPKAELTKLLRKCGGQVTSNVKKAKLCIGADQHSELVCVDEKWLLDCIMKTQLLAKEDYILKEP